MKPMDFHELQEASNLQELEYCQRLLYFSYVSTLAAIRVYFHLHSTQKSLICHFYQMDLFCISEKAHYVSELTSPTSCLLKASSSMAQRFASCQSAYSMATVFISCSYRLADFTNLL